MSADVTAAPNPRQKTKPLSDLQLQKLLEAQEDSNNARAELQRTQQTAKKAASTLTGLVAVILDAVGAPANAEISLQHGIIIWPESPADADRNGVSKAAEVSSPPPDDRPSPVEEVKTAE